MKTKKYEGVIALKLINKTAYNELITAQEYTVCFHIIEETKINLIKMETREKSG